MARLSRFDLLTHYAAEARITVVMRARRMGEREGAE
jgi:hypothetical protein